MGKLHSKHATVYKPRESPEGDSFVVNACLTRKGMDDWMVKQKYYCSGSGPEQQDCEHKANHPGSSEELCREEMVDQHYRLEVALPPEKMDSCCFEDKVHEREGAEAGGARKPLKFEELECAVSVEEDNRQEWTFTLYDFDNNGKVTREDITSLLHTIYEVVDASVNHSPSTSKTLRVKLSVAPESAQWKSSAHPATDPSHSRQKADKCIEDPRNFDKKSRALLRRHHGDHPAQPGCRRHCVDENLERRNHYLDLAGIENYTSRFGSGTVEAGKVELQSRPVAQTRSRSHEPEYGHSHLHHRRSQTAEAPCLRACDEGCARHALRSPKTHSRPLLPTQMGVARPTKLRGDPLPPALLSHGGQYRKHKQRTREAQQAPRALGSVPEKGHDRELPGVLLYEPSLGQVVQRHQHHHHHEHHHHYHHFYQS